MNIAHLLNQQVQWAACTGSDSRSDRTYAAAVQIPGRRVLKARDIIGKDGEVITTVSCYTLGPTNEPAIGDKLDGNEVVMVDGMTTVGGSVVGYQAYTR